MRFRPDRGQSGGLGSGLGGGGLTGEIIRLGLRRVASAPRLSAVLLIGSLLAVALAASAPIFIEAVRDLGLRQILRDAEPTELDLRFLQNGLAADRTAIEDVREVLASEATEAASGLIVGDTFALRTGGYIVRAADQPEDAETLNGTFAAQSDLAERVELSDGRLPQPAGNGSAGGAIEIALERGQAEAFGLAVGDELIAQPFWLGTPAESRAVIVGLFEPPDDARAWSTLDVGFLPISARETELRFWTTQEELLGRLAEQSPTLRVALLQRFRLDISGLVSETAEAAGARLEIMETRLAQQLPGVGQTSELTELLTRFRERFRFAQGTLMMVVLQLVGAVLVYSVIAAAMLAEQRTEDTAWLRSRGARRRDIALLHIVEAALLTAPAVVLGPLIGMGLVSLLGLVPPFDEALGGGLLPVRLPALAWYVALGAGALALLAQAIPAYRATGQTIVTTRRARGRPPESWRQRALVDVAIVALGALLIFELQFAGGPVDTPLVGETRIEWLTVITPTVLMAVVGLIVLRLFPALMRLAARLATAWRWLTPLLGAWYLGRTPTHYARTVLLLAIAGALAVFAGSFRGTLESSYNQRALHAAGANLRLLEPVSQQLVKEEVEAATGSPAAQVSRIGAVFDGDEDSGPLSLAALDAETVAAQLDAGGAGWTVEPDTLRALAPPPVELDRAVIERPAGQFTIRIRNFTVDEFRGPVWFSARFQDANGRYWGYVLGSVNVEADVANFSSVTVLRDGSGFSVARDEELEEWHEVSALLSGNPTFLLAPEGIQPVQRRSRFGTPVYVRPDAPLTLVSIDIGGARARGSVEIDEISYRAGSESQIIEDFEGPHIWQATPLAVGEQAVDYLIPLPEDDAARFSWTAEVASLRGIRYAAPQEPLPMLMSRDALEQGRSEIGDEIRIRVGAMPMLFRIAGVFDHFPTWDPGVDPPLLIVDRAALFERIFSSAAAGTSLAVLDELWLDAPLASIAPLLEAEEIPLDADEIISADAARSGIEADPLLVAAWNGVFIGALAAVAVAASFGLVVLMSVTAQARRVEFAVCQSVGMSARQILGLIGIEQIAVIIVGLGAGLIVGTQAGPVLLDFFSLTPEGRDVVPPLEFLIDWQTVGIQLGALVGLFALNLTAFLYFLRRIELHGALRLAA